MQIKLNVLNAIYSYLFIYKQLELGSWISSILIGSTEFSFSFSLNFFLRYLTLFNIVAQANNVGLISLAMP